MKSLILVAALTSGGLFHNRPARTWRPCLLPRTPVVCKARCFTRRTPLGLRYYRLRSCRWVQITQEEYQVETKTVVPKKAVKTTVEKKTVVPVRRQPVRNVIRSAPIIRSFGGRACST
jgi:hypothetical protein